MIILFMWFWMLSILTIGNKKPGLKLARIVLQFNVIVHFILLTHALNIDIPVLGMFIIIPIALILMLIPVSINDIGLRETVFVFLFGIYGVAVESAVAFAWVSLAMILFQGVIGGIVFLFRRSV